MRALFELQWAELDAQAVVRYRAGHAPGAVIADGYDTLRVASRVGTLHLRRQVCVHAATQSHVLPGNALLPQHRGMVITRGLTEWACLLPQELPFATVARLLGWQTGAPAVLSATMVRPLVRDHGARARRLEQTEATAILRRPPCGGQRLRTVPHPRPRRRAGWPPELTAAVEAALAQGQTRPPAGLSWADWERVLAVRRGEVEQNSVDQRDLRDLGPQVAPGQLLLLLDEVLTPARDPGRFHELRTACLLTTEGRRYLSGSGRSFLVRVLATVLACYDRSLLVIADGAAWIRAFFRDHLAHLPQATMVLDWHHLKQKCRDLVGAAHLQRSAKVHLLRRLWRGDVPGTLWVLQAARRQATNPEALEQCAAYLQARAEWIPDYRARRRQGVYIGSGLVEKANDCIVARRQKHRGMQWSAQTSETLATLRTLVLNDGWHGYWVEWRPLPLVIAA